jgi:amidase
MMQFDSHNNIYGRVLNPRNKLITAGGSSGGEGALLAMRGSVLGVGTDVGGSIRVPALCNGLYGIKPSAERIPYAGQEGGTLPGSARLGIAASAGPMAHTLRDCELLMKVIADGKPWELDPTCVPQSWNSQVDEGKGRRPLIGIVRTDGVTAPLPPIAALTEEVVSALKASGVDVVDVTAPLLKATQSIANGYFTIDGYVHTFELLEKTGEPLSPWLDGRMKRKTPILVEDLRKLHARRMEVETGMLEIWKDASGRRIDALICPVAPHPVPPVDRWNAAGYCSSFVLLDYPAAVSFLVSLLWAVLMFLRHFRFALLPQRISSVR